MSHVSPVNVIVVGTVVRLLPPIHGDSISVLVLLASGKTSSVATERKSVKPELQLLEQNVLLCQLQIMSHCAYII